jgi:hypothetical protein
MDNVICGKAELIYCGKALDIGPNVEVGLLILVRFNFAEFHQGGHFVLR